MREVKLRRESMAVYKSFPQANLIREWDKLIKLSKEEVAEIYEEWKVIHEENEETNKRMYEEKNQKINEAAEYFKGLGIDVYKYKKSGFFPIKIGFQAWFKNNVSEVISKKYPYYRNGIPTAHMEEKEVNGVKLYNNQSPTNLLELYDKISWQYRSKINEVRKVDKLLIKSIEYATKHNIDLDDLNTDEIIRTVDEYAKEKYLEENLPNGSDVYLKHCCDECITYIMGEHRCSCGNRRIYIEVEGNIIEGFTYYPEAY